MLLSEPKAGYQALQSLALWTRVLSAATAAGQDISTTPPASFLAGRQYCCGLGIELILVFVNEVKMSTVLLEVTQL